MALFCSGFGGFCTILRAAGSLLSSLQEPPSWGAGAEQANAKNRSRREALIVTSQLVQLVKDLDPSMTTSACYLYVSDANALYETWRAAGVGGRLQPPADTEYGLREFAHVDPDGNLLRIGSPLKPA
jgi:hypothetical protein